MPTRPERASGGPASPVTSSLTGERRIITALFCDVVDSTAMAEGLDPEEWAEIMNGALQRIMEPIDRYGGKVARLLGDAVLAFFGAPTAHEDDPQRAVLAGLGILEAIGHYREEVLSGRDLDFQVRVGVNTGPVVVADVGSDVATEYTAMGDAVNVAARMEQTARPGCVQISGETYVHVAPLFNVAPLGGIELKGKTEPIEAYRVLSVRAEPGRLRGIRGVSAPLIGRDREFDVIKDAMRQVREGRGQILCLIGEAGIGKTRLIEEARAAWLVDGAPGTWEQTAGSPHDSAHPYGLFHRLLKDLFQIDLDDPPDVIHEKTAAALRAAGASEEAIAQCSIALERIVAAKVLHESPSHPPEVIEREIYEVVYPAWREYASRAPAVMVLDDIHWADQASVDLLLHLFGLAEEAPLLFLCALRPERQSPAWQVKLHAETNYPHRYTELTLAPLAPEQTDDLVGALFNIADLPEPLRVLIMRKSEGNPYFVEEVVRSLIDQGVVSRTEDGLRWNDETVVDEIEIPDTLQALLMARIDRLDRETRATLQLAAVIGRTFYHRVLKAISDSTIALDRHLSTLQRVELVREAVRIPELEYIFRHELTRDAAYGSILRRRRRALHQQVGEAMEMLFAERIEPNAHRLAQHFAAAGDAERALKYFMIAAESAAALSANADAAVHYAHAVEAARHLDLSAEEQERLERRRAELVSFSSSRSGV